MDVSAKEILLRYALPGPRYTSYPPAAAFLDTLKSRDCLEDLRIASLEEQPLSLYVQLPSCRHLLPDCSCSSVAHRDLTLTYLQGLDVEMALIAEALDERRHVGRLHLDGGMSAFLDERNLERLWKLLTSHFRIEPGCEMAVELIPGVTSANQLRMLRGFGFARLSLEVGDWGHRTVRGSSGAAAGSGPREALQLCRELGFPSVHVDLLYALPGQSLEALAATLEEALELRPERLALHNLATLPKNFLRQRGLDPAALPPTSQRVELQLLAHERIRRAGYRPVGFDHFAVPADRLCQGLDRKRLHRGFLGYSADSYPDLIGVGIAAVAEVQGTYRQNAPRLSRYLEALARGELPVVRGYRKDPEDELRGEVIQSLLCLMEVDLEAVARTHGRSVQLFGPELAMLQRFEADGLVRVQGLRVRVTELGRLAARTVAMVFDHHMRRSLPIHGVPLPA